MSRPQLCEPDVSEKTDKYKGHKRTDVCEQIPPECLPQVDHLVTEDDEPVDSIFSERQQRLLVESLYASWKPERSFVALANVGLFYKMNEPALVPDVLLSLDVTLPENVWLKYNRSYFIWEYGKPPEVVVEVVSNVKGKEDESKLLDYEKIGIAFYVIYDPEEHLKKGLLRTYELQGGFYQIKETTWLEKLGLGLTLWQGTYEGMEAVWLRWCDSSGQILLTGEERAEQEQKKAEQERQRAEQERLRAEKERLKAERLAARLRALGEEMDDE